MLVSRMSPSASPEAPLSLPYIEISHRTARRTRFRLHLMRGNSDLCRALEERLMREQNILTVKARAQTASLIVEHEIDQPLSQMTLELCLEELWDIPEGMLRANPNRDAETSLSTASKFGEMAAFDFTWCTSTPLAIMEKLDSTSTRGLKTSEIEMRRQTYGSNALEDAQRKSRWRMFRRQFGNSQTLLLAGSAGLSLLTGGFFDVIMIGGVIFLNGFISYLSESHAEEAISSIGHIEPQDVRVIRDGVMKTLLDIDLVVGDIVVLMQGVIPADIRLIESKGLLVDESPLTGESMPVSKHHAAIDRQSLHSISDRRNLVFRGTIMTSGQGLGIVIGTGDKTEIGRVRQLVASTQLIDSPLQKDLEEIGRQTIWVSGAICGGVFAIGLLRGSGFIEMLKTSVSLAIAAVPEGLPTVGTTTMALGVSQLKKQNVLVRRLNVLETLGSVEILCLDKTGTLTLNDMIAEEGYFGGKLWHRSASSAPQRLRLIKDISLDISAQQRWGMVAGMCTDSERLPKGSPLKGRWSGSATEKAIVEAAELQGIDVHALRKQYPRFKVSYRTEERQYMVTYHTVDAASGRNMAAAKGNPEQLLDMCAWTMVDQVVTEIDAEMRELLVKQNRDLARKGLRVLGFAFIEGKDLTSIQDQKLVWVGSLGLMDPTREGMVELIEQFHQAGIKTIMMTGDQTDTAKALGKALGFNGNGNKVKTADARVLHDMTLDQIADLAENVQVFSRVSPTDKLRIVQALQARGRIVAMTGDGINDSPALKAAHVGIAMGFQGTSAARESADIVLKDDNPQVLYHAIEQGRSVRANLRKSIKYLLGTNLSEISLMFISIAMGRGSPLNSVQLLWINLLTDVLPGLALALDPPAADLMQKPPVDPSEPLLSREAKVSLFAEAALLSSGALLSSELSHRSGAEMRASTTSAFVSLTTSQILHTVSASAGEKGLIRGPWPRNKKIYGAMGLAGSTIALGVISPSFRKVLGNAALSPAGLAKSLANGIWPLVVRELLVAAKGIKEDAHQ